MSDIRSDRPSSAPLRERQALPLDSATLLGQHGELLIRHHGEVYRLRRTRQGKLILTK